MKTVRYCCRRSMLSLPVSAQIEPDYLPPFPQRHCDNPPMATFQREATNQTTGLPPQEREAAALTYLDGMVAHWRMNCETVYQGALQEWVARAEKVLDRRSRQQR